MSEEQRKLELLKEEVVELIAQSKWKELAQKTSPLEELDLVELISELPSTEATIIFRLLPRELSQEVFSELDFDKQEDLIEELANKQQLLSRLLNDLDPDDRTALFEEMPGVVTKRLLQLLSTDERKIATQLLGYPKDSIGRLMTPEYIAVKPSFTIAKTLKHIQKHGKDSETLSVIYVVNEKLHLIDDLRIREILLANPEQTIAELMDGKFIALNAFEAQEEAVKIFQDHDRVALPVTDSKGVLLGIVTVDDVMDVAEEESSEDFHKFGSVQEMVLSPLRASIADLYQKRIVWLFALVFVNVFSGAAIAGFEKTLAGTISLVFFLPLLIGSGGNSGAQAATLTIRGLATGDLETHDWLKLLGKEILVSALLGLTMALGVSIITSLRSPEIVMVVGLSMFFIVLMGSSLGLLLPFIFTRLKIDPATASAPLITSISDILGILIYFTIATKLLGA